MANFTAADVKKLRDMTGSGMMDCKKALEEADGDFDAAADILRTKGQAKMAKRAGEREAKAGLVATSGNALVELNCETDFVAKGDDFIAIAQQIADAADAAKSWAGWPTSTAPSSPTCTSGPPTSRRPSAYSSSTPVTPRLPVGPRCRSPR